MQPLSLNLIPTKPKREQWKKHTTDEWSHIPLHSLSQQVMKNRTIKSKQINSDKARPIRVKSFTSTSESCTIETRKANLGI